jgi:hypothetical protein
MMVTIERNGFESEQDKAYVTHDRSSLGVYCFSCLAIS